MAPEGCLKCAPRQCQLQAVLGVSASGQGTSRQCGAKPQCQTPGAASRHGCLHRAPGHHREGGILATERSTATGWAAAGVTVDAGLEDGDAGGSPWAGVALAAGEPHGTVMSTPGLRAPANVARHGVVTRPTVEAGL